MTRSEFKQFAQSMFKRERDILFKSAQKDYGANSTDRLDHFNKIAIRAGITPAQALLTLMSKHVVTFNDALNGNTLSKNSIEEVAADIANYAKLGAAMYVDMHMEKVEAEHLAEQANT